LLAYSFRSYRDYLRDALKEKKVVNSKHSAAWLADQIGVQRSYLSRVLKGDASLNADQLYTAGKVLHLNSDERAYLLLLLEIDRTTVEDRRKELEASRDRLQAKKIAAGPYLKRTPVVPLEIASAEYYSLPLCSIVHMHLTIPKFLARPTLLREHLSLSPEALTTVLNVLERCGIIEIEGNGYRLLLPTLHTTGSRLSRLYATQFRLKAIEYQQKLDNDRDYFFTSSFSASESTRDEIKQRFLEFLSWVGKKVDRAEAKEVFHLNFDLFKI
jgi:uncharacterized protein (TIGR02147 family)